MRVELRLYEDLGGAERRVVGLGICTGVLMGMVGALIEDGMLVKALWRHIECMIIIGMGPHPFALLPTI